MRVWLTCGSRVARVWQALAAHITFASSVEGAEIRRGILAEREATRCARLRERESKAEVASEAQGVSEGHSSEEHSRGASTSTARHLLPSSLFRSAPGASVPSSVPNAAVPRHRCDAAICGVGTPALLCNECNAGACAQLCAVCAQPTQSELILAASLCNGCAAGCGRAGWPGSV